MTNTKIPKTIEEKTVIGKKTGEIITVLITDYLLS